MPWVGGTTSATVVNSLIAFHPGVRFTKMAIADWIFNRWDALHLIQGSPRNFKCFLDLAWRRVGRKGQTVGVALEGY